MQNIPKIIILDFGSQYTQLIARKLRELSIYCEIHPFSISEDKLIELLFTYGINDIPEEILKDLSRFLQQIYCQF